MSDYFIVAYKREGNRRKRLEYKYEESARKFIAKLRGTPWEAFRSSTCQANPFTSG